MEKMAEDWPVVKKRWEAWWQGNLYDRPPLVVTAPLEGVSRQSDPEVDPPVDPETQYTDTGYIIRRELERTRTTYYGGDALPYLYSGWVTGNTLLFGCRPHFEKDTLWIEPAPVGADGYPVFDGWRDSPWWRWQQASTAAIAQASQGRYYMASRWGNHAGDTLEVLRGPQQFLLDFADNPGWVRWAVNTVSDVLIEVFGELRRLSSPDVIGLEGSMTDLGVWSPGKTEHFECDMSCSISDDHFRELILPPLVETMRTVDYSIYHLDGTNALHHLDTLLSIPELHAIQWWPSPGDMEIMQWIPVIEQIRSRGKSVYVQMTPEEVLPLLGETGPEGLCIQTGCRSESDARSLVDSVASLY